jgi:hypothetical protein
MKVKRLYNERGSQSESGSEWKWLYNKSEGGSDYAMKGSESYYTLKVKVKGVIQWKGSESGYTQNESNGDYFHSMEISYANDRWAMWWFLHRWETSDGRWGPHAAGVNGMWVKGVKEKKNKGSYV